MPRTRRRFATNGGSESSIDLLVQKVDKTEGEDAIAKLRRRYSGISKRMHQIDSDELLEMYVSAITSSFDPHTTYMSASTYENFAIQMRLKLEGIGAALQFDDGYTKVSKLIPGGAAEKDGRLKPEDHVVGVGQGEEGDIVDVVGDEPQRCGEADPRHAGYGRAAEGHAGRR